MADLFDRLFVRDGSTENISVHYFFAAIVDYAAGETTRQQMIQHWSMDTEAQADLNVLCNRVDSLNGPLEKLAFGEELHAVMMLAESGAKYATKEAFRTRLQLGG